MAPAHLDNSSCSGGSSRSASPGMSTPVMVEEGDGYHFTSAQDGSRSANPKKYQQPIAIVGMSCRFPGGSNSPAEFWELCSRARSGHMAGAPKDRFNHEAFYHANPGKTGAYHSKGGYFLNEDPALFDAPFFSLTEKEAIAMDPQQRMLLECTFEALENAGIPKQSAIGGDIGVFIGASPSEYETHLSRDSESMPMHQSTGCAPAMQSNKLSHFFDFRGPSLTIDTACSGSLVALHAACQSLRNGEAEVAITGGCHLNLLPDSFISFSIGRLLSDSGRSIAFDERGTGFGRGEGCGILVLKSLKRAIADKDAIRAVIRGTGINQDGKTAGITMPNGDAQEKLINQVYANAGLDPRDCGFVEAHGTGTKIGDPTEAGAIYRALGQDRPTNDPLYIGSVKSNIGHLEGASGVAAVIKAALSLERGFILANHDFKKPNPKIPWKEWNLVVPKAQRPWPKGKKYISVNNFGFGGTNAHVVLERAPFPVKKPSMSGKATGMNEGKSSSHQHKRLFLMSANDKQSLEAVMASLVVYLEQRPEIFQSDLLEHLSYTLARRSLLKWRVAVPATTSFELIEQLNSNGIAPNKASVSNQNLTSDLRLGFVFTGQGAQWHAMGRELYGTQGFAVYTAALARADRCLRKMGAEWSLVDELIKRDAATSRVGDAHISQPACTAVQLCLVDLLHSWGVRPTAVTGHSSGEIAAAYAAGFITFKSAMAIAYHRGRMIPILKKTFPRLEGTMMAVGGSKEEMQTIIDRVNSTPAMRDQSSQIRIACYNSPSSLTVSGDVAGIAQLETVIRDNSPDTFNRRLQVETAYHSHHMDLVAKEYKDALAVLDRPKSVRGTRFYSSLYGRQIDGAECDAAYWVDNLTRPVRFSEALTCMVTEADADENVGLLVELGPHSALQGPVKQILQAAGVGKDVAYSSALVRKRTAIDSALDLAAIIIAKGGLVNVDAVNTPGGFVSSKAALLTDLPRYAWNHQKRYWHEARLVQMHNHRAGSGARSELIGLEAIYSTHIEPVWRNVFSLDDLPWLRHHRIQGMVVFPLAGFVTMAVEAASQRARALALRSRQGAAAFSAIELRDVEVLTPLAFPTEVVEGGSNIELSISLRKRHNPGSDETWDEFHICSWSAGKEWTEHCVGLVMARPNNSKMSVKQRGLVREAKKVTQGAGAVTMGAAETTAMYADLSGKLGVEYGPSFQAIEGCNVAGHFAAGHISTEVAADNVIGGSSSLHPAVLESVIEMYWPILRNNSAEDGQDMVYLPSSIRHMCIATNGADGAQPMSGDLRVCSSAQFGKSQPRPTSVDILATAASPTAADASNFVVAIEGLVVSPIVEGDMNSLESVHVPREVCYKMEWEPLEDSQSSEAEPIDRPLPETDFLIIYSQAGSVSFLLGNQVAVNLESATMRLPGLEEGIFDKGIAKIPDALEQLVADKTVIVLTEIDQAFLADADELQFETFKTLATTADKVLWITRGAYMDSTNPAANIISGISRTIRSETLKPFAHLDLQAPTDLIRESEAIATAIVDVLAAAFGSAKTGDMEFVYRATANTLLVPRVVNDSTMDLAVQRETDPLALQLQPYGRASAHNRALRMQFEPARLPLKGLAGPATLHEVSFVDDALAADTLADDEIEIQVQAVGVTAHDALMASSSTPTNTGLEASGVVTRVGSAVKDANLQVGKRVACLTAAIKSVAAPGAYATFARTTLSLALPLQASPGRELLSPESLHFPMSLEEAAALPLAYCTAYHALIDRARLEAGQRVLVTCPAGAVGQAAICLAVMEDAAVFILAESAEERENIVSRYAGVIRRERVLAACGANHGESRETHDALNRATGGNGFDVILDLHAAGTKHASHVQKLLQASLAPFGCQVQVQEPSLSSQGASSANHSIHAVHTPSFLDSLPTPPNASVITVDLLALARSRPAALDSVFAKVAALFRAGKLARLQDVEALPFSRAHEALNGLHGAAATVGKKMVLVHRAEDLVLAPPHKALASAPIFKTDATYVIVGGTGGLGRSMAAWMVAHGARHVVLLTRSAEVSTSVRAVIAEAAAVGAHIHVQQCDVADAASVDKLLSWVARSKLPLVRGVIHSAMVLRDVLFEKMSHAEYQTVIEAKVQGSENLHRALDGGVAANKQAKKLDFFIVMSSVSAVVGNRGQAAYAAANTYLDALVQHRLARGLPAVSLALGAVSDAGYLADLEGEGAARAAEVLKNLGGSNTENNTICEAEVLALLRAAVVGDTASCGHHVITGVAVKGQRPQPFWAGDAKFGRILGEGDGEGTEEGEVVVVLSAGLSQAEAEDVVCRGLVAKIAVVLMMEPEELDVTRSLSHYPLDSLVAIEVRNFIARQYEASLQVLELLSSGSIQTLSAIVCKKSKLRQGAAQ